MRLAPAAAFCVHRHDAAHRVEPAIKAPDVGDEGREHAHGDVWLVDTSQMPKAHTTSRPISVSSETVGVNSAPGLVELVVGLQVVLVGGAKALGLALLLGKGLDHADAGDGVGQHVGDFRPDAVDLFEAGAQAVAHRCGSARR